MQNPAAADPDGSSPSSSSGRRCEPVHEEDTAGERHVRKNQETGVETTTKKKGVKKQELGILQQLGIAPTELSLRKVSELVESCHGIDFVIQLAVLFMQHRTKQFQDKAEIILENFLYEFTFLRVCYSPLASIMSQRFYPNTIPSSDNEVVYERGIIPLIVHLHVKNKPIPTDFFYTLFPATKTGSVSRMLAFFSDYKFITKVVKHPFDDRVYLIFIDPKVAEAAKLEFPLSLQIRKSLFRKAITFFWQPLTKDDELILEYQRNLVAVLAEDRGYYNLLNPDPVPGSSSRPFEFSVCLGEPERLAEACQFLMRNLFYHYDNYPSSRDPIEQYFAVLEFFIRTSDKIDIVSLNIMRTISEALSKNGNMQLSISLSGMADYCAVGIVPGFFQNLLQVRNKTLVQCQGILLQYKYNRDIRPAKERYENALKIEQTMCNFDNLHTYSCQKLMRRALL